MAPAASDATAAVASGRDTDGREASTRESAGSANGASLFMFTVFQSAEVLQWYAMGGRSDPRRPSAQYGSRPLPDWDRERGPDFAEPGDEHHDLELPLAGNRDVDAVR